jgi:hypothetical protein
MYKKVEKAKQFIKETCPKREIVLLIHDYLLTGVEKLEKVFFKNFPFVCCVARDPLPIECRREALEVLFACETYINKQFPDSTYRVASRTGVIKYPNVEVNYQGGNIVAIRYIDPNNGVEYYRLPKTLKLQFGSYSLTFAVDQNQNSWELIEVNLPVEATIERLALTKQSGVKINYKEIIPLLNSFFKETAYGLTMPSYRNILISEKNRQDVFKAFLEYLAWDNFKRAELAGKKKTMKEKKK